MDLSKLIALLAHTERGWVRVALYALITAISYLAVLRDIPLLKAKVEAQEGKFKLVEYKQANLEEVVSKIDKRTENIYQFLIKNK